MRTIKAVTRNLLQGEQHLQPPNPSHKRIFGVFRAQGICLVAAQVVLFRVKRNLETKANVVVSECTICYRINAY